MSRFAFCAACLAALMVVSPARAQCSTGSLTAGDADAGDLFGFSVAISNDLCVVSARLDDKNAINTGAAYVYRFDGASGTWVFEAKLAADDAATMDEFGYSVAACAAGAAPNGVGTDVVIIGARYDDDAGSESGSAYIFRKLNGAWVQMAKLTASDAAAADHFGYSVAICGNLALVSSRDDDAPSTNMGSAYVFKYNGSAWVQQAKLKASDGAANDQFAQSVALAMSADGASALAICGSWHDDSPLADAGSAYLFRYSAGSGAWTQEAKLTAPDAAASDVFGYSVSVCMDSAFGGDVALVGARDDDDLGNNAGSAYVFRKSGASWVQEQKLTAADRVQDDGFGYSVSIDRSGETALIGAWHHDVGAANTGAAYVYTHDMSGGGWAQLAQLSAADAAADDLFGSSVSVCGDKAIIGAPQHDLGPADTGVAYIYTGVAGVDVNHDGGIDSCQMPGDVNGDGKVDTLDLLIVMGTWGLCPTPPAACAADLNGDGMVDMSDILTVIGHWSP